jgi:hypothetical protein
MCPVLLVFLHFLAIRFQRITSQRGDQFQISLTSLCKTDAQCPSYFSCLKFKYFTHSFSTLSCERSIASSKASYAQGAIYWFLFQILVGYLLPALTSTSNSLRLLARLLVRSIFPSETCFRRQFLGKMWPIHLVFFRFILCALFLSSLILCT